MKAPKKGREKETRDKDQSPGKLTAQKRQATRRKEREPLRTEPSTSCMKHFFCLKILFNVNGKATV